MVVSWGRLGPEPGSQNPTSWLGLLAVAAPDDASKAALLFVLVPSLVLLLLAWWLLQRVASARRISTRTSAFIAMCWALPFAVGPILASRDAYAYVAQGELARRGLDPANSVVSQLGPGRLLDAVDPRWRETRPPYGGVAVAIQKAAAAGRDPAISLIVLRLVAVCAVLALVVMTVRFVAPNRRPFVIAIVAANPLVLIQLVAGAHLDAVAAALLVAALLIARGDRLRTHWFRWLAIVVCSLGAMVKLPVALGVVYLMSCALVASGPSAARRLRNLAGDLTAAAAGVGLSVLLSGTGLGWVHNFGTPGRLRTAIAPADLLANALRGAAWIVGLHPQPARVLADARLMTLGAGILLSAWLLCPRRSAAGQWTPTSLNRLGLALLSLSLLGPVLYGWYLAPALPLLAIAASRGGSATRIAREPAWRARWAIIVLSTVLVFASVPSLTPAWQALGDHPGASVGAALTAALVLLAVLTFGRERWGGRAAHDTD